MIKKLKKVVIVSMGLCVILVMGCASRGNDSVTAGGVVGEAFAAEETDGESATEAADEVFATEAADGEFASEDDGELTAEDGTLAEGEDSETSDITGDETEAESDGGTEDSEYIAPETEVIKKEPVLAKALYIAAPIAGSSYFDSRFELTQTTEINALVINVKDESGKISFKNKIAVSDSLGLSQNLIPNFDGLMERLKENNVYSIARLVSFIDDGIVETRPEYALPLNDGSIYREKTGNAHVWLNPYNRDVWEYLAEIAIETAKLGFDEIQLDYVRFPTDAQIKNVDFTDEMTGGLSKKEIMIEFAKFMMEKLAPYDVVVAADVFGTIIVSELDAGLIGQDYVELAKIYDVLCPMIYPSHFTDGSMGIEFPDLVPYDTVNKVLQISNQKLDEAREQGFETARIRPWLQDFKATWIKNHQSYTGKQIEEQIRACEDNGIFEWMLWDTKNNFNGFRDYVGQPYE